MIPVEQSVVTLTKMGYIKRLPSDTYRLQHRGGKGVNGMSTREEDITDYMFVCSSHDYILFFSNFGRVYRLKAYEIPEGSRTAKGLNIINVLPLQPDEKITVMLNVKEFDEEKYLCMVTKKGIIKRSLLNNYNTSRKGGVIAVVLDEGDELRWVQLTNGNDDVVVATHNGVAIRFNENDARPLGRTARGVKAIALSEDDEIVGMAVVDDTKTLMTVTETGYGRRSEFSDYRCQSRGGKGITNYKVEKYGKVTSIQTVTEDDDAILITSQGIIIRIATSAVSTFARTAKGVRVMRVKDGEYITAVQVAEHEEQIRDEDDEETVVETVTPPATAESQAESKPEGVEEAFNALMENAEKHEGELE